MPMPSMAVPKMKPKRVMPMRVEYNQQPGGNQSRRLQSCSVSQPNCFLVSAKGGDFPLDFSDLLVLIFWRFLRHGYIGLKVAVKLFGACPINPVPAATPPLPRVPLRFWSPFGVAAGKPGETRSGRSHFT